MDILQPQPQFDVCGFRAQADNFVERHDVGHEFTPRDLKPMERHDGVTEKSGQWPLETRKIRCGACTGTLLVRTEEGLISEMGWIGQECRVKATAIERARLAAEEAASGIKKKLL